MKMKYIQYLISVFLLCSLTTQAAQWTENLQYKWRLGYNIGGTAPIGMPATIRSMNEYKLQPNFTLGFDVEKPLGGNWGITTGIHLENKGMKVDATVKNYHIEMRKGSDPNVIMGYYTGNLVTEVEEWMLTLPVQATYSIGRKWQLRLGPYISYVATKTFEGYVYDGYLRTPIPTGDKILIGNTEESRGTYDFSDEMRHIQAGVDIGADFRFGERWGVYGDVAWGLTGIHRSSFKTIEQTLYPIFGTFGITYRLK